MKHLLPRLKKAFPFIGKRSATETDFYDYCVDQNIQVIFSPFISEGVYVVVDGEYFIFLNNKLKGWMLLYVMFHELAHHIFHHPSQRRFGAEFFTLHSKEKNHYEAETVASLLLFPMHEVENALIEGVHLRDERLAALIAHRLEIAKRYGS